MYSHELENYIFPFNFEGYDNYIFSKAKPHEIKNICVNHEYDSLDNRISDIDVYYKNQKISRKNKEN